MAASEICAQTILPEKIYKKGRVCKPYNETHEVVWDFSKNIKERNSKMARRLVQGEGSQLLGFTPFKFFRSVLLETNAMFLKCVMEVSAILSRCNSTIEKPWHYNCPKNPRSYRSYLQDERLGTANCKPSNNALTEALIKVIKPFLIALQMHILQRLRKWKKKPLETKEQEASGKSEGVQYQP